MERKNTDQLQQELMTGNDLDRVLADNDSSFQGYALQERLQALFQQREISKTSARCISTRYFPDGAHPPATGCCACASALALRWMRHRNCCATPGLRRCTPAIGGMPS